jgi:hypothetical protein
MPSCQYILDSGPWKKGRKPKFCPETAIGGSVYCAKHHKACYAGKHYIPSSEAIPPAKGASEISPAKGAGLIVKPGRR